MSEKATAYTQIRDRLRADIFAGLLKPGSKLTVAMLAKRYGVSPMPIRAALQELRGQGLITGEPRRAARVRTLDAEFVDNVFDLRIAVLKLLYERCVRFITNDDIEKVERIQDALEAATVEGDLQQIRRINHAFHTEIYRIANNPEAAEVMERNWILVDVLRAQFGYGPGRIDDLNRSHRGIIEALRRRDAKAAFELQRLSSERARRELISLVREGRGARETVDGPQPMEERAIA